MYFDEKLVEEKCKFHPGNISEAINTFITQTVAPATLMRLEFLVLSSQ